MLGFLDHFNLQYKPFIASLIVLLCFLGSTHADITMEEWTKNYFNAISEKSDIEEVVNSLYYLHQYAIHSGCNLVPDLPDLIIIYYEELVKNGFDIPEETLWEVYDAVVSRSKCDISALDYLIDDPKMDPHMLARKHKHKHKHKHKKHKDGELKMSSKMALGFAKFIAGGLCCIIPFPATMAIGTGLMAAGICDMIDSAHDESLKTEKANHEAQQHLEEHRRRMEEQEKECGNIYCAA